MSAKCYSLTVIVDSTDSCCQQQGVGQCREKFHLVPPLKTLRNKYDKTNKIEREVIKLPKVDKNFPFCPFCWGNFQFFMVLQPNKSKFD
jgi:hypothetical protein